MGQWEFGQKAPQAGGKLANTLIYPRLAEVYLAAATGIAVSGTPLMSKPVRPSFA